MFRQFRWGRFRVAVAVAGVGMLAAGSIALGSAFPNPNQYYYGQLYREANNISFTTGWRNRDNNEWTSAARKYGGVLGYRSDNSLIYDYRLAGLGTTLTRSSVANGPVYYEKSACWLTHPSGNDSASNDQCNYYLP